MAKSHTMKIPKSVLAGLIMGVAVQASGCKKDKESVKPDTEKETVTKKPVVPESCPACGMG